MKLAIISLDGKTSQAILNAARKYFTHVEQINIKNVEVKVDSKKLETLYDCQSLQDYDCVYIRGSYKYTLLQRAISASLFDKCYMPLHSTSFTIGHDKFLTLLELRKHDVPLPESYVAATVEEARNVLKRVSYPIILKIPSGTQGKGVMFADSISSARSMLDTLEIFRQPYIIEEYIETDATDIRAIVLGDKVIAAMRRKATSEELRANIHMGGIGEAIQLDYDTEQIAVRAAKAVKADICGVDILQSSSKTVVIEVNLSPGLEGISAATNRDIASDVAAFLHKKSLEFADKKRGIHFNGLIKEAELSVTGRKELVTNLDIKAGIIKLPNIITRITGFNTAHEVSIVADKDFLEIKKRK